MKKLLSKKVKLFGREVSVFVLALIGLTAMATAALIPYFGMIIGTVSVSQGLFLDGHLWNVPVTEEFENFTSLEPAERMSSHLLENRATTAEAFFHLENTCDVLDPANDCDGVTTTIQYPLYADGVQGSEDRVVISATEAGIDTLGDLSSMTWMALNVVGYMPHVDVILDIDGNGVSDDALVFEYAKVNPGNCDPGVYPTGNVNTFADNGIIDDDAYAWLNSGDPGPCTGNPNFFHYSLADWKAGVGGHAISSATRVLRLEFEIDNWIINSSCTAADIEVNNVGVDGSFLKPGETLDFDLMHQFEAMLWPDTYTLTTTVESAP